ncbi:hypothetical protein RJT34_03999 [Clitoria ternatea]|uniref:Transmembrane protein n=1 Tax=Clitoria ternatea TaxID=43366 RepID=A0AAN9Q081_CLITE
MHYTQRLAKTCSSWSSKSWYNTKMDTCRVAIVFTIYMMAVLVSAHCFVAESVAEDVAAIPPTPMESGGVHLGAPDAFVVIAFVVAWFS